MLDLHRDFGSMAVMSTVKVQAFTTQVLPVGHRIPRSALEHRLVPTLMRTRQQDVHWMQAVEQILHWKGARSESVIGACRVI